MLNYYVYSVTIPYGTKTNTRRLCKVFTMTDHYIHMIHQEATDSPIFSDDRERLFIANPLILGIYRHMHMLQLRSTFSLGHHQSIACLSSKAAIRYVNKLVVAAD